MTDPQATVKLILSEIEKAPQPISFQSEQYVDKASFDRLVKVLEKCVEQRDLWKEAYMNGDDYIKEVGVWKIFQREREELLSIAKGIS